MVGGLVAANSSTILTHLNWGASYLVHDFYRRFMKPGESESHYVRAGRFATVLLFVTSSAMVFVLDTAQESFMLILQVGAGTGLLYLLRWFWWRVTAWCEIVAMISSFGISVAMLFARRGGMELGAHRELVITVAATTVCWLATAYLGPQTDRSKLIDFYHLVRPLGPGWTSIRIAAGVSEAEAAAHAKGENIPLAMIGWVSGSSMIWSALFAVGNFLYGRTYYAVALTAIFAVSALVLIKVVRTLWK